MTNFGRVKVIGRWKQKQTVNVCFAKVLSSMSTLKCLKPVDKTKLQHNRIATVWHG